MLKKILTFMLTATLITFIATLAMIPFAMRSSLDFANDIMAFVVEHEEILTPQSAEGIDKVVVDTQGHYSYLYVSRVEEDHISMSLDGLKLAEVTPTVKRDGSTMVITLDYDVLQEFKSIERLVERSTQPELYISLPRGVEVSHERGSYGFYEYGHMSEGDEYTGLLDARFAEYLGIPTMGSRYLTALEQFALGNLTEQELRVRLEREDYGLVTGILKAARSAYADYQSHYEGEPQLPDAMQNMESALEQLNAAVREYLQAQRDYSVASVKVWCKLHGGDSDTDHLEDLWFNESEAALRTQRSAAEQQLLAAQEALDAVLWSKELAFLSEEYRLAEDIGDLLGIFED